MPESLVIVIPFIVSVLGFAAVVTYNALRGVRTTREALGTYLVVILCSFALGVAIVAIARFVMG